MKRFSRIAMGVVGSVALCATLSACATGRAQRDAAERARYEAHAGAPVDRFRLFGQLTRWTALDDASLVVWTRPSEAWLLDLTGPCPDLEYAYAIGLTDTLGSVQARFDKVLVSSRTPIRLPCYIARIRPVDVKALKADRDASKSVTQDSGT